MLADQELGSLVQQLDEEIQFLRSNHLAASTRRTYATHERSYRAFCELIGCDVVPATPVTIARYVAYLARTKCFSTIKQYTNIIRLLHLENGFPNPMENNYRLQTLFLGIRRVKGDTVNHKLHLTPVHLLSIQQALNFNVPENRLFWATLLSGFFGLLRVSNLTCKNSATLVASDKCILQNDISFHTKGVILKIRASKTIQCSERVHTVVVPRLNGHPLCPASALLSFLQVAGPVPYDAPLFAMNQGGNIQHLTANRFRSQLVECVAAVGLEPHAFNTHSMRRGGATWFISVGIPMPIVKALGDWRSDAVFRYIQPDAHTYLNMFQSLPLPTVGWK